MQTSPRQAGEHPTKDAQLARRAVVLMREARDQHDQTGVELYTRIVNHHVQRHLAELRRRLP